MKAVSLSFVRARSNTTSRLDHARGPGAALPVSQSAVQLVRQLPDRAIALLHAPSGFARREVVESAVAGEPTIWVDLHGRGPGQGLAESVAAAVGERGEPDPRSAGMAGLLESLSGGGHRWLVLANLGPEAERAYKPELLELLSTLPQGMRVAITTSRWLPTVRGDGRLSSRLHDLGIPELALSLPEVTAQLGGGAQLGLRSRSEVVADLTGGWPRAVAGAAQVVRAGGDAISWLAGPAATELLRSWLATLPPAVQRFLLRTAMLRALHPDLCDEVLGRSDSARILRQLANERWHVSPAPDLGPAWLRRSPLLTRLLADLPEPAHQLRTRHRLAANWYGAGKQMPHQVHHLLAAGDIQAAAALVSEGEVAAFDAGSAQELAGVYAAIPAAALGSDVEMQLRLGWAKALSGDPDGAFSAARRAAAELDRARAAGSVAAKDHALDEAWGDVHTLDAFLAGWRGDARRAVSTARAAQTRFGARWDRAAHAVARLVGIQALLDLGEDALAERELATLRAKPGLSPLLTSYHLEVLTAVLALADGRILQAQRAADLAWSWLSANRDASVHSKAFSVQMTLGLVAVERGHLAAGRNWLSSSLAQAESWGHLGLIVDLRLGLARLARAAGEPRAALGEIARARELATRSAPQGGLLLPIDLAEAQVRLGIGEWGWAARLVSKMPPGDARTLLAARVAALRRPGPAPVVLARMQPRTPRDQVCRDLLLAAGASGATAARSHLTRALQVSREHGMALALLDAPAPVRALARQLLAETGDEWLAQLVGAAEPRPGHRAVDLALSPGELALLRLLPGRDTYEDIANRLNVSVNTVKTRLRRLYGKLGVHDRGSAVAKARELGVPGL